MDKEAMKELVQLHARQLGEHFDNVQILVTTQLDGGEITRSYDFGVGNIHARLGHAQEWLIKQAEFTREIAREEQRGV